MEGNPITHLAGIDYAIMAVYFAAVLGVGFALKRVMRTSTDFFLAGKSLPAWVTGLAFISANLGAQEVIGMEPVPEREAGEIVEDPGEAASKVVDFLKKAKVI